MKAKEVLSKTKREGCFHGDRQVKVGMHRIGSLSCTLFIILSLDPRLPAIAQTVIRGMKYTSRRAEEAVSWQTEVRSKLCHALKMDDLVSRKGPVLFDAKVILSQNKQYTLQEIEINSLPGRRIKIVLTLPTDGKGPFPAVVCIHGHGGSRHSVYDVESIYRGFATALAENGYVTISTDVGQHEIYEAGRLLMGERLWDLMQCVDYLISLDQVDRKRIGCAGLSLGGEMAMWLGAMVERILATVSSGFLTRMDQLEQNHCMCWKFPGLRELVDFADIYSLIAPRTLICQNGLQEDPTQFPVTLAREALKEIEVIYSDFKRPNNIHLVAHDEGHVIDLPSLLSFFAKHLGQRTRDR